jgi:PIN domain nuclease of toxin-antitoxin system
MRLLLDTHIWLWWINNTDDLPLSHRDYIEQADELYVSVLSCWELAYLCQRRRIELLTDIDQWFDDALKGSGVICLPCSRSIAISAAKLPEHHRDPADRFIIATAVEYDCNLMSFDNKFSLYEILKGRLIGRELSF